ncbi:MAG: uroporphyrinogen decarboxylase family protein [Fimbriimonas sp.]|nr:uroporphyrinogen decarboxylase family protein [Fimbriimonas sp.]
MSPRQRLLNAIDRKPVDRVPISTYELVGFNSRAWENQEPSYDRLMSANRECTDCIAMWNPGSDERFLLSAHPVEIDTVEEVDPQGRTIKSTLHTPKGDLNQTVRIMNGVHTTWQTEHWCKSTEDVDRALSVPYVPVTHTSQDLERIFTEVGDRGIVMSSTGDALLHAAELMEMGEYTVWAMTETDHFLRTVEVLHERNQESIRNMLETAPADLYRICGPEYATPPYLPPSLFERFVVPFVREQVDLIHEHGAKVRFHCHGKIGRVLDAIAAVGADAIDPCEAPPSGDIELDELKRALGPSMCLFGNLQLHLLEHSEETDVRREVRRCMDAAKAGGGFVIMPTAAPINVPLNPKTEANYLVFIEEALACGAY